ncbi:MAG: CapA family protein [Bacteroidota bacterium]
MVKIGFAGDFCPWKRMELLFEQGNWQEALSDARQLLTANDLNVLDLECPLTLGENAITKTGPHLKAHPKVAAMLPWLKCHLVATANNHFMDYGAGGLQDTQEALRRVEVDWIGSGQNFAEASAVYTTEIKGRKFAFVNMAENEWSTTYGAEPGCNPLDLVHAQRAIAQGRKEADFVIVIIHGGHEYYNLPSPRMKREFRFMVNVGADAVLAHHTHVVSGYEQYQGRPIFYGLGNFCFDWEERFRNHSWNIGMLLHLQFEQSGEINFHFDLIRQNDEQAGIQILGKQTAQETRDNILQLNEIIQDDAQLEHHFRQYCEQQVSKTMTRLEPYANRYLTALHKRQLIPSLLSRQKQILLTNLVRCESHREVLLEVLKRQV